MVIRYYDPEAKRWIEREDEFMLDTRAVGLRLKRDDTLVAWWDEQRGMFVPAWQCAPASMVDFNGEPYDAADTIFSTESGRSDIRFELEISEESDEYGEPVWKSINNRICKVNGNVFFDDTGEAHCSGSIHYTFIVDQICLLRVRTETDLTAIYQDEVEVSLDLCSFKIRSYAGEGVEYTQEDSELNESATVIPLWTLEAEVGNV